MTSYSRFIKYLTQTEILFDFITRSVLKVFSIYINKQEK